MGGLNITGEYDVSQSDSLAKLHVDGFKEETTQCTTSRRIKVIIISLVIVHLSLWGATVLCLTFKLTQTIDAQRENISILQAQCTEVNTKLRDLEETLTLYNQFWRALVTKVTSNDHQFDNNGTSDAARILNRNRTSELLPTESNNSTQEESRELNVTSTSTAFTTTTSAWQTTDLLEEDTNFNKHFGIPKSVINLLTCRQGQPGEKGEAGSVGLPGIQGEKGSSGEKGDQGFVGSKGMRGSPGEKGERGLKGDTGNPGERGVKGDLGSTGTQGEKGNPGQKGATGNSGSVGQKGERGDQGPTGNSGPKGDKGDSGPKGSIGNSGNAGIKGEPGSRGLQGVKGAKGDAGATGVIGPRGATGLPGRIGQKGEAGVKGAAGNIGQSGAKGEPSDLTAAEAIAISKAVHSNPDRISSVSGKVYAVYDRTNLRMSWTEAFQHCREQGANLPILGTLEQIEQFGASVQRPRGPTWLAAKRMLPDNQIFWINSTNDRVGTLTNNSPLWAGGEPNNSGANICVELWGNRLNDHYCSQVLNGAICEFT